MTDVLEGAMGGMESAARLRESMALAYWERVVGAQAAAASSAESVRDGVLFVRTRSSVWSHELTFMQDHIRRELNRLIGKPVIREIVYRAQGVERRERAPEPEAMPSEVEISAVILPAEVCESVERARAEAASIGDPRVRAAVERRIEREARLRHWRIEHGWRVCTACGSAHRAPHDLCHLCRVCG